MKNKRCMMVSLELINDRSEILLNSSWIDRKNFNSKDRLVDENGNEINSEYGGRAYRIIEMRERNFSAFKCFCKKFLGTVIVISTLCLALLLQSVRDLFTKSKEKICFAIPLLDEHKKIIKELSPQMVKALGGIDNVLSLPIQDLNSIDALTTSVYRAYANDGSVCVVFCYDKHDGMNFNNVVERLKRVGNKWKLDWTSGAQGNFNIGILSDINDGSLGQKYMLEKISRLIQGKPIGQLKKYDIGGKKPEDKSTYRPNDAYLKGNELDEYMDIEDAYFYETNPQHGITDIRLHDFS